MDIDLVEEGSIGALLVAADIEGRSWDGVTSREDLRGRSAREGSGLVVECSHAKDAATTELPGIEEADGETPRVEACKGLGGEIGHGAICWPKRWVLSASSRF